MFRQHTATMAAAILLGSTTLAAAALATAQTDLNVRAGPGTEYPVVAVLPGGAPVDVGSCGGGWCQVNYRGTTGYASASYLAFSGARAPAVVSSPAYEYGYDAYGTEPYYGYSYGPEYGTDYGSTYSPSIGLDIGRGRLHRRARDFHRGGGHFGGGAPRGVHVGGIHRGGIGGGGVHVGRGFNRGSGGGSGMSRHAGAAAAPHVAHGGAPAAHVAHGGGGSGGGAPATVGQGPNRRH